MKYIILMIAIGCSIIPGRGRILFPEGSSVQAKERYVYIGAEACAMKCHNGGELGNQYEKWKNTRHSESFKSLQTNKALEFAQEAGVAENPQESMVCMKCHVTAAGYDTASIGITYRKNDGVTCEACHKGEFNPKTFIPKEEDCLKCHNDSVHAVSPFDFQDRCRNISHPRPKTKHDQMSAV